MIRPAPRRSRRRLAVVAVTLAALAGGWVVLRDPRARLQLNRAAHTARRRIEEMRAGRSDVIALEPGQPLSIGSDVTAPTLDDETIVAQAEAAASSE